jgi:hypothetical protein
MFTAQFMFTAQWFFFLQIGKPRLLHFWEDTQSAQCIVFALLLLTTWSLVFVWYQSRTHLSLNNWGNVQCLKKSNYHLHNQMGAH